MHFKIIDCGGWPLLPPPPCSYAYAMDLILAGWSGQSILSIYRVPFYLKSKEFLTPYCNYPKILTSQFHDPFNVSGKKGLMSGKQCRPWSEVPFGVYTVCFYLFQYLNTVHYSVSCKREIEALVRLHNAQVYLGIHCRQIRWLYHFAAVQF